jgi:hypothetical protein
LAPNRNKNDCILKLHSLWKYPDRSFIFKFLVPGYKLQCWFGIMIFFVLCCDQFYDKTKDLFGWRMGVFVYKSNWFFFVLTTKGKGVTSLGTCVIFFGAKWKNGENAWYLVWLWVGSSPFVSFCKKKILGGLGIHKKYLWHDVKVS